LQIIDIWIQLCIDAAVVEKCQLGLIGRSGMAAVDFSIVAYRRV
jgi:hypothetical protein